MDAQEHGDRGRGGIDESARENEYPNRETDPVEILLGQVRQDLKTALDRPGDGFEGIRSELVFQRVLAKIKKDRQRRLTGLGTLRVITATAATLWNSRFMRMLMP